MNRMPIHKYRYKNIACNNYLRILFIACFFVVMTSCATPSPIAFPTAMNPSNTYRAGKGEVGGRLSYSSGGDVKIGITDNIQVLGIACPVDIFSTNMTMYEAGIQINAAPHEMNKYLHIFGIGAGTFVESRTYPGDNNQTNYVYEGYYPGYKLMNHISLNFPLRLYEFEGRYNCYYPEACPRTTGAKPMERYQGATFVSEVDWCFDWTHLALRLGLSSPLQFWESANPHPVIVLPSFAYALYYKW